MRGLFASILFRIAVCGGKMRLRWKGNRLTIRLFGKSGPTGQVATAHTRQDGGLDVVAYFPAVPIVQALGEAMGVKVKVRRSPIPKGNTHG